MPVSAVARAARLAVAPTLPRRSASFYCPQSFQRSFVPLETGSPACSANFTGNIIGQERSVVPSTRLFNILRTVFSLPCLFPPTFELLRLPLSSVVSLSLSFSLFLFSSLLSFHSFVSLSPFLSFQLLSFDVRKLASVHFFCDFIAALNNRRFLLLAPWNLIANLTGKIVRITFRVAL